MADPLEKCFSEAKINGLTLRNRLIKAATFEGKCPGGIPSKALTAFHERIGRGGIAMTTIAYCAAEADGRIHENMMYMHEGIRHELEHFIRILHGTGTKVSGQLGHAGGFTKNREFEGKRPLGPSKAMNALGLAYGLPRIDAMTKEQITERVDVFARAATFMKSVGFDAIEIHFGHGYGISQFISPKTNKRTDEYGGSLTNRMRFALEVLAAVRTAVGEDYPLLGKISMTDGVAGGVTYEDSVEIAAMLEAGGLDVIVCSGGTSSMNPMLLFRGDSLVPGLVKHERSLLMKIGIKLSAPVMFKNYPYEETYFLEHAQRIRDRVQCGVCYIGGVCTTDSIRRVMSGGFDFIQLGRALIFDPDFPKQARARPEYKNGCSHCNQCATLIEAPGGIYCVERPNNFA
ncbi:MAG: NADH:flavin oxidoreductase [Myxococcales bacterium]|nr:NADH:flavin oxidoreductase [Myxococcales bacterium]MDH3843832.1 NADH:flavin oxidoreductase [Myxococcales bacterium]